MKELLPLNITIPVFNRPELTELTIVSVRKHTALPHVLTVVDNGSEIETRNLLLELKKRGLIDHLFRLEQNHGVACACNIGWRMLLSPLNMKLDNDVETLSSDWCGFALHTLVKLGGKATLGADFYSQISNPHYVKEPAGLIGKTHVHVSGGAILIPRGVSDVIGYWCEDYGIYGCEDGDYGLRVLSANLEQYYFNHKPFMRHLGADAEMYIDKYNVDKKSIQNEYRSYFRTNASLISRGHRSPNIPMRHKLARCDGYNVEIRECESYAPLWEAFCNVHEIFQRDSIDNKELLPALNRFIHVQNATWETITREVDESYAFFRKQLFSGAWRQV